MPRLRESKREAAAPLALLAAAAVILAIVALASGVRAQDKPLVAESHVIKTLPANTTLQVNAGASGNASVNVACASGAAPSSPNDGDVWCTSAGLYVRVGSTTVGPLGAASPGTVTSIATSGLVAGGTITSSGTISLSNIGSGDVVGNSGGSSAAPADVTLTAVIDRGFCSTEGDILYRGASSWLCLGTATSGDVLATQGPSAIPQWVAPGASTSTNPWPIGAAGVGVAAGAPPVATYCPATAPEGYLCENAQLGFAYSELLPASTVPARVQEKVSLNTFALTLSGAPTPGDYLIAMGWLDTSLPSVASGWTLLASHNTVSADPYAVVAYRLVQPGDSTAWTPFTGAGATCASGVEMIEVSGVDMVNIADSIEYSTFATATAGGSITATASHTTAVSNELGVTLAGALRTGSFCALGNSTPTINAGWTNVVAFAGSSGVDGGVLVASQAVGSSSAITSSVTYNTGGTNGMTSFVLFFEPTSDRLTTGWQQMSYLTTVESGGTAITPVGGARTLNFTTGLAATSDADGNVTVTPSAGVSCSGSPTGSFAVTDGIVTHC